MQICSNPFICWLSKDCKMNHSKSSYQDLKLIIQILMHQLINYLHIICMVPDEKLFGIIIEPSFSGYIVTPLMTAFEIGP
jgi:hypothetical protein